MQRTISAMVGKGSVNHNSRKFKAENVDGERSYLNIDYCNNPENDSHRQAIDETFFQSFIMHYNLFDKFNIEAPHHRDNQSLRFVDWLGRFKNDKDKTHPAYQVLADIISKKYRKKQKKPMLSVEYAVGCAMRAMKKRRLLCTCNWYTKMQHVLFKILPDPILTHLWLGMLEK